VKKPALRRCARSSQVRAFRTTMLPSS